MYSSYSTTKPDIAYLKKMNTLRQTAIANPGKWNEVQQELVNSTSWLIKQPGFTADRFYPIFSAMTNVNLLSGPSNPQAHGNVLKVLLTGSLPDATKQQLEPRLLKFDRAFLTLVGQACNVQFYLKDQLDPQASAAPAQPQVTELQSVGSAEAMSASTQPSPEDSDESEEEAKSSKKSKSRKKSKAAKAGLDLDIDIDETDHVTQDVNTNVKSIVKKAAATAAANFSVNMTQNIDVGSAVGKVSDSMADASISAGKSLSEGIQVYGKKSRCRGG